MFPIFTVLLLQALAKTNAASLLATSGFLANPDPNLRVNQGQWSSDPWAVPPSYFLPSVLGLPNALPSLVHPVLPGVLPGYPRSSWLFSRYKAKRVYPGSLPSFSTLDNQLPGETGARCNAAPPVYHPYGVGPVPRVPSDNRQPSFGYNNNWGHEEEAVLANVLARNAARKFEFSKIMKNLNKAAKVAKGVGSVLEFVNDKFVNPSQEENNPPPS